MPPRPRRTMTEEGAGTDMTMNRSITRLEDIEAIKQLKALYCLYCDDDYDAIKIGSLFTEDGIWDGETMAADEYFTGKKIKIKKSPFSQTPSYIIKN